MPSSADGATSPFAIYWMDKDGRRELLVADERDFLQPAGSARRAADAARPAKPGRLPQEAGPLLHARRLSGPGPARRARGTVKKLRVVALDYRAAGIGNNENAGPGRRGPRLHAGLDRKRRVGREDRAGRSEGLRRRIGVFRGSRPNARLFPGDRREGPRDPDDAKLDDVPARRGRVVRRLSRKQEHRAAGRVFGPAGPAGPTPSNLPVSTDRREGSAFAERFNRFSTAIASAATKNRPPNATPPPMVAARSSGKLADRAFSLLDTEVLDATAKRKWSQAYLTLTASRRQSGIERSNSYRGDPQQPDRQLDQCAVVARHAAPVFRRRGEEAG